ncbi:FMN-binding protein [Kribbella sp. NBC_00889]|uniref:FMN-binding protein n=1 Tax=Kribbella sp. NBC_00889 TaxID=2975974 RepID=UPI003865C497|nr:FMN-binding protein [Kribbella sp. NBC_00889]
MRRGIKLVMSAATLVVAGVAVRTGVQPHPAAGVVSSVQAGQPTQVPTRPTPPPADPSGSRTAPTSRPSPIPPASTRLSPPKSVPVTVAGEVVQTEYGPVQVEIILQNGRITRARALARPSGDGQTDAINSYAIPQLDQETLAEQGARVDTVSGATFTSEGYRRSLQAALDAAHRAGAR